MNLMNKPILQNRPWDPFPQAVEFFRVCKDRG